MSSGNAALITGASAGLGREYAKLFAADGHDVVLVARRRDRLEALAKELEGKHRVRAHVVAADLGSGGGPRRVLEDLRRLGVEVGFLVNNAGFGTSGAFAELDADRELEMVQGDMVSRVGRAGAPLRPMVGGRNR